MPIVSNQNSPKKKTTQRLVKKEAKIASNMPLVVALFASRLLNWFVMSENQCYLSLKTEEFISFIVSNHGF